MSKRRLDHRDFGVTAAKARALNERLDLAGIADADLDESFVVGTGRGGQKRNRTANAVQLVHVPTGRRATASQARSRGLNRYFARRRLVELFEADRLGSADPSAVGAARVRKQKARRRRRHRRGAES